MNTVMARFNTTVGQMTEISQEKLLKCLSEIKTEEQKFFLHFILYACECYMAKLLCVHH